MEELFVYDDGKLLAKKQRHKWNAGQEVGSATGTTGYRVVMIDGYIWGIHRLVFFWHHGWWPELVDHIDRTRTNNRIENLRASNKSLNALNSDKHGRRRPK